MEIFLRRKRKNEKSNKNLPVLLNNEFGINKSYDITSIKDTQKVVLYYVFINVL